MSVDIDTRDDGKVVVVRVNGKLEKEDYERFAPKIESLIERHGKVNMLVETHDFHGWKAGALWEDIKFDAKHFNDIEKLAIVGEKKWEKGMALFCKPFTTAKVRFFEHEHADEAERWVQGA